MPRAAAEMPYTLCASPQGVHEDTGGKIDVLDRCHLTTYGWNITAASLVQQDALWRVPSYPLCAREVTIRRTKSDGFLCFVTLSKAEVIPCVLVIRNATADNAS